MTQPWPRVALVLCLLGLGGPTAAPALRATVGLEYDDNPFETTSGSRRAGWVSRLFLYSSGRLAEFPRGTLQVRHQWGLKRFWKAEEADSSLGDVVASQVEVTGSAQVHDRVSLTWGAEAKVKNVQRVTSEESYLHGGLRLGVKGRVVEGLSVAASYRRGGDDARSQAFADRSLNESGLELRYGRSRRMRGHLGLRWRWSGYDRRALRDSVVQDTLVVLRPGPEKQADRGRELTLGVQVYHGALVHASYVLLDNRSNSVGYSFRAHRGQLVVSRHLVHGIDGQVYLTLQRRRYEEELQDPGPSPGAEEDEYEQSLFSLQLSRQMTERYGLSCEYRRARNGTGQKSGSYRKNIYALSVELVL